MQVATLFRESTTLLGAGMDSGGVTCAPESGVQSLGPHHYDSYNHPVNFSNKYKV